MGTGLDNSRQKRARRQVLRALLWEVQRCGIGEVRLDARRPIQNRRDVAFIDTLRVSGEISHDIRIEFVDSKDEPLLWLADIVAGAVSSAWGDNDDGYVRALGGILEIRQIELG